MNYTPKPHVSPALAQFRRGVTVSALVLALCAVAQMLVFGFVHFTQVRWEEAPPPQAPAVPYTVVAGQGSATGVATAKAPAPATLQEEVRARPNLARADGALRVVSDLAVTGGVISAVLLAFFSAMGVCVAAGAAVPGVARAVSACTWAALIAAACLPWSSVLSTVPYSGVFGPYSTMTAMSEAASSGTGSTLGLLIHFLLMPTAAMAASFLVIYRFRAGVDAGVLVTSASEMDERIEREMANIRSRGVEVGSRAMVALNHAIADVPTATTAPAPAPIPFAEPVPLRKTGTAPAPSRSSGRTWMNKERSFGQSDPGDPLKRPI